MSVRCETIGDATLYLGDCREVLPTLGRVDAVITSPPYDGIRDYGGHGHVDMLDVVSRVAHILDNGGVCMWNTADQVIDGSESGTSFRVALHAMECGLRLHDTMIACRDGVTFPDASRYHPAFEYMFIFSKGAPRHFNGIKDWRNKYAGAKMHGTDRQQDGTTKTRSGVGRDIPALGLRRNWWIVSNPHVGESGGHPAPMPKTMAGDHIETWTVSGEVVADPFMGSGTTGVACARLGRRFIGIEIEPRYFDIACRRIEQAQRQRDLFIHTAPPEDPAEERLRDLFAEPES